MTTTTGVFDDGATARAAVGRLRAAGFEPDDILFVLVPLGDDEGPRTVDQAGEAGRRLASLAADAGETTVAFVPFVGREMIQTPLAHALRDAAESTAEAAARVAGAAFSGGLSPKDARPTGDGRRATVIVHSESARAFEAASVLTAAGAVEVLRA
jgi:hypothetical protein